MGRLFDNAPSKTSLERRSASETRDLAYLLGLDPPQPVALQRERQLKRWSRAKKVALIQQQTAVLVRLSQSREQNRQQTLAPRFVAHAHPAHPGSAKGLSSNAIARALCNYIFSFQIKFDIRRDNFNVRLDLKSVLVLVLTGPQCGFHGQHRGAEFRHIQAIERWHHRPGRIELE
jgi:hypothetical protein